MTRPPPRLPESPYTRRTVRVTSTDSKPIDCAAIAAAVSALRAGGVIACPTEAVWGLSCDPRNENAVERVLALKQRGRESGLILIAAAPAQVADLLARLPEDRRRVVLESWPGPVTWVCPSTETVPHWIRGEHAGVALRITAHPIAAALCDAHGGPLVSTSANRSGSPPARTEGEVRRLFPEGIDALVPGATGGNPGPTEIRDALTGTVLRASP